MPFPCDILLTMEKRRDKDVWCNICLKQHRDRDILAWRYSLGNNFSSTMRNLIRWSIRGGVLKRLHSLQEQGLLKLTASDAEIEQALFN